MIVGIAFAGVSFKTMYKNRGEKYELETTEIRWGLFSFHYKNI